MAFTLAALALFPLAGGLARTPGWSGYRWPVRVAGLVQRVFVLIVFGMPVLLAVSGPHRQPA